MKDKEIRLERRPLDEVVDMAGGSFGVAVMIIKNAALEAGIPINSKELQENADKAAAIAFGIADAIREMEEEQK